jgi:hypothetical protein
MLKLEQLSAGQQVTGIEQDKFARIVLSTEKLRFPRKLDKDLRCIYEQCPTGVSGRNGCESVGPAWTIDLLQLQGWAMPSPWISCRLLIAKSAFWRQSLVFASPRAAY